MGSRPDLRQAPGTTEAIGNVNAAGDIGLGKPAKFAKQDLNAMREGRIEDAGSLRPVLSAINANKASSHATMMRETGKSLAFQNDPMLEAAVNNENDAKLDENAGVAFAGAAGGAYDKASDTLAKRNQWQEQLKYQSAVDAAKLKQSSMYDARRTGGLLPQIMQAGVGIGQAAAMGAV